MRNCNRRRAGRHLRACRGATCAVPAWHTLKGRVEGDCNRWARSDRRRGTLALVIAIALVAGFQQYVTAPSAEARVLLSDNFNSPDNPDTNADREEPGRQGGDLSPLELIEQGVAGIESEQLRLNSLTGSIIPDHTFGSSGAGDTNGDGVVNIDDLNNDRNNFGATVSALFGQPVLEPTGLLLALGSFALLAITARRHRAYQKR